MNAIKQFENACFLGLKKRFVVFMVWVFPLFSSYATAQEITPVVRLAKLQIDTAQFENYKAALKEEIETSVRIEPGVLSLYAVYDKNNHSQVTIFEIYASENAYNAHRESLHLKKYKSDTKNMVKFLELVEASPIVLMEKNGKYAK